MATMQCRCAKKISMDKVGRMAWFRAVWLFNDVIWCLTLMLCAPFCTYHNLNACCELQMQV